MTSSQRVPRLPLFPITAEVNGQGHLLIGRCDTVELAARFGTPLYVYDEAGLREKCAEFRAEFGRRYPETVVLYASKAFLNSALALLIKGEGLGLDVVSGGEMGIAHAVGFPMEKVYFHGNNKSHEELIQALEWSVGRIVVDNFHELAMLAEMAKTRGKQQDILLRMTPGVDPHTHQYNTTGNIDSKFGFPQAYGEQAVATAMATPGLNLVGLHFHIGSLIFEVDPYQQAIDFIIRFAVEMNRKHGLDVRELDVGGGFAVQYTLDTPAPPISTYAEAFTSAIKAKCQQLGMRLPRLVIEPGRSIVARACVALYTAGAVKDIPGVRTFVSVDGGMADNIRPALYGARQEAVLANRMLDPETSKFTIAGKFCESGDILIRDISLPRPAAGDIVAVPGCGAYCLPQACNYNASYKVAVAMVRDGQARLIRRRETLEDLLRCDVV